MGKVFVLASKKFGHATKFHYVWRLTKDDGLHSDDAKIGAKAKVKRTNEKSTHVDELQQKIALEQIESPYWPPGTDEILGCRL